MDMEQMTIQRNSYHATITSIKPNDKKPGFQNNKVMLTIRYREDFQKLDLRGRLRLKTY